MRGGLFLESYLAYSVYDFLQDREEENRLSEVSSLNILNKIAQEAFSFNNRQNTRNFLTDLVNRKKLEIYEQFRHYLIRFYRK